MTDDELNLFLDKLESSLGDAWIKLQDILDESRPSSKTEEHLTTLFSVASAEAKLRAAVELKRLLRERVEVPDINDDQLRMVLIRLCELSGADE